ncbi:MAG TPA: tetratricopeptide repeat protein [Pirellulales bacterium]|nr:tetratricopeptide repeat protein [Pirellulales bacterium]
MSLSVECGGSKTPSATTSRHMAIKNECLRSVVAAAQKRYLESNPLSVVPTLLARGDDREAAAEAPAEIETRILGRDLDDPARVIEEQGEKIKKNPSDAEAYYDRGNAYAAMGRRTGSTDHFARAIADYSDALRADYTMLKLKAYNNRAMVHLALREYDEALIDLKKAIDLDPKNPTVRLNRALVICQVEACELVLEEVDVALKLDPRFALAWSQRGIICRRLSRPKNAVRAFDKAIEIDPNDPTFYNNRGSAYQDLGKFDEALQDYDRAIALDANYAMAYRNRAKVFDLQNIPERAAKDRKKAEELEKAAEGAAGQK